MKKLNIAAAIVLLMFAACQNYHPSVIRANKAKEYRSKTTRISQWKKNRRVPPLASKNSKVGSLLPDKTFDVTSASIVAPWIHEYTGENGLPYPQYFIMSSAPLLQFMTNSAPAYLHVYLALNNQTSSPDLVIVGAQLNASGSQYSFADFAPVSGQSAQVFSGFMIASEGYGVIKDNILEPGMYKYLPYPSPPNLIAISSLMPLLQADTNIYNYQQSYDQFALAYSFLINTQYLLAFLTNPSVQWDAIDLTPKTNVIQYIQIYLAYENSNPNTPTIILVGLTADGHHVYYNDGSTLKVFNTAVPCPFCNVDPSLFAAPAPPIQE